MIKIEISQLDEPIEGMTFDDFEILIENIVDMVEIEPGVYRLIKEDE